jgi:hypothetical protein
MSCFECLIYYLTGGRNKPALQDDSPLTVDILAHTVEITQVDD